MAADTRGLAPAVWARMSDCACIIGVPLMGLALLLCSGAALAHRLQVFASADGNMIQGKAYFVGGHPARGLEIQVLDAVGDPVATLSSNEEGRFRARVPGAADYRVVAKSGDGHRAEWPIAAAELLGPFDDAVPSAAGAKADADADSNSFAGIEHSGGSRGTNASDTSGSAESDGPAVVGDTAAAEHRGRRAAPESGADAAEGDSGSETGGCLPMGADLELALRAVVEQEIQQGVELALEQSLHPLLEPIVEQAVVRQLLPLREALAEAQAQASFRDVLGGIGYIAGLAGLGLWWTQRRQSRPSGKDRANG